MTNLKCLCSSPTFSVFKANQLFSLEINVLYNLMLNMECSHKSLKISLKFSSSLTPLWTYAFKTGVPFLLT